MNRYFVLVWLRDFLLNDSKNEKKMDMQSLSEKTNQTFALDMFILALFVSSGVHIQIRSIVQMKGITIKAS